MIINGKLKFDSSICELIGSLGVQKQGALLNAFLADTKGNSVVKSPVFGPVCGPNVGRFWNIFIGFGNPFYKTPMLAMFLESIRTLIGCSVLPKVARSNGKLHFGVGAETNSAYFTTSLVIYKEVCENIKIVAFWGQGQCPK